MKQGMVMLRISKRADLSKWQSIERGQRLCCGYVQNVGLCGVWAYFSKLEMLQVFKRALGEERERELKTIMIKPMSLCWQLLWYYLSLHCIECTGHLERTVLAFLMGFH